MNREQASAIHINHALGDTEVAEIESACNAAAPGAWYSSGGGIIRHGGAVVDDPVSLRFMAAARADVPRLIRWIRALEEAYWNAKASERSMRNSWLEDRRLHELALERLRGGEPGPRGGLTLFLAAARLGLVNNEVIGARLLNQWTRGEDIGAEMADSILRASEHTRAILEADPNDAEADVALGAVGDVVQLAAKLRVRLEMERRERDNAEVAEVVAAIGKPAAKKFFEAGLRAVKGSG